MTSSLILVLCGALCLGLCFLIFHKARPRPSQPEPALVATEGRATSVAMLVLILFFAGVTMLAKGLMQ
jgi:hypothetical protein